jgi:hypothetical protein
VLLASCAPQFRIPDYAKGNVPVTFYNDTDYNIIELRLSRTGEDALRGDKIVAANFFAHKSGTVSLRPGRYQLWGRTAAQVGGAQKEKLMWTAERAVIAVDGPTDVHIGNTNAAPVPGHALVRIGVIVPICRGQYSEAQRERGADPGEVRCGYH